MGVVGWAYRAATRHLDRAPGTRRAPRSGGAVCSVRPVYYHRPMPIKRTVTFEIREQWYGTEEEYAAARQLVRRLIVGSWARAFAACRSTSRRLAG